MYAAAAGASLGSRQARKQQRQQNTKNRALLQQGIKDKLAAAKAAGVSTPPRSQSRQFHQLPPTYLRTPTVPQGRKLSAGYTTQSKLLLPIAESSQSDHPNHQINYHPHHHQRHQSQHGHPDERYRRQHLTKSATATLPLYQVDCTPPSTPTLARIGHQNLEDLHHHQHSHHFPYAPEQPKRHSLVVKSSIEAAVSCLPFPQDSIIVTPASPGPTNQLERKCSVYRSRKTNTDAYEKCVDTNQTTTTITANTHDHQLFYNNDDYSYYNIPNGGHNFIAPAIDYNNCGDSEYRHLEICTCDHVECAQGRAAWLERGRRCSVQDNPASCHRRWVKRNRIHDSSLGGSSDDEDLLGVLRGPSSFANAFLYVGLGTVAIGLVIAFVGTGEKGFKTVELRLIGPSLIVIGLICCILRIFFCICPSHCISSSRRARNKKNAKIDADHTTSLLRGDSKRVSIARGLNQSQPKQPQLHKSISKTSSKTSESVEALRKIATTSFFLQNEQKTSSNRIVPIIKEPENLKDVPLEMKKIDSISIDMYNLSDEEDSSDDSSCTIHNDNLASSNINCNIKKNHSKLVRQRAPINQIKQQQQQQQQLQLQQQPIEQLLHNQSQHERELCTINGDSAIIDQPNRDPDLILMETSLMIIEPERASTPPITSPSLHHDTLSIIHAEQEIVLSPAKLGQ